MQTNTAAAIPANTFASMLRRLRIVDQDCYFAVLQQGRTTTFELRKEDSPIMAFRYEELRQWQLAQRKDAFEKMFRIPESDVLSFPCHVIPKSNSPTPIRIMWQPDVVGESGFWASSDLAITLHCLGKRSSAIAILWEGVSIGYIPLQGYESDEPEAIKMAQLIKKGLRNPHSVRVEGIYNENKVISFI